MAEVKIKSQIPGKAKAAQQSKTVRAKQAEVQKLLARIKANKAKAQTKRPQPRIAA